MEAILRVRVVQFPPTFLLPPPFFPATSQLPSFQKLSQPAVLWWQPEIRPPAESLAPNTLFQNTVRGGAHPAHNASATITESLHASARKQTSCSGTTRRRARPFTTSTAKCRTCRPTGSPTTFEALLTKKKSGRTVIQNKRTLNQRLLRKKIFASSPLFV